MNTQLEQVKDNSTTYSPSFQVVLNAIYDYIQAKLKANPPLKGRVTLSVYTWAQEAIEFGSPEAMIAILAENPSLLSWSFIISEIYDDVTLETVIRQVIREVFMECYYSSNEDWALELYTV